MIQYLWMSEFLKSKNGLSLFDSSVGKKRRSPARMIVSA